MFAREATRAPYDQYFTSRPGHHPARGHFRKCAGTSTGDPPPCQNRNPNAARAGPAAHVHATRRPNLSIMEEEWDHGSTRGYANQKPPMDFGPNRTVSQHLSRAQKQFATHFTCTKAVFSACHVHNSNLRWTAKSGGPPVEVLRIAPLFSR